MQNLLSISKMQHFHDELFFLLFPMHYSKTEPVNKIIFVLSRVCWSRNIVCLLTTFTIIQSQRENFLFVLWLGFIGHCQVQPKLRLRSDLYMGNLGTCFWKRSLKKTNLLHFCMKDPNTLFYFNKDNLKEGWNSVSVKSNE